MEAVLILVIVFLLPFNAHAGCIESERQALLRFKQDLIDPSNRLASWSDQDCCDWVGISCHQSTSRVLAIHLPNPYATCQNEIDCRSYENSMLSGNVSSSLLDLTGLSSIDLSHNNFSGSQIPSFFGSFKGMTYLNLSHARFEGTIPEKLGALINLRYLDLNCKYEDYTLHVQNLDWISSLVSLKYLDMSNVDLGKISVTLPSLQELHLSKCQLQNVRLLHKIDFSSILKLDLSDNHLGTSLFSKLIFRLKNLVFLDLSGNRFQGPIPNGPKNISTSLVHLDLSVNSFNSSIPNFVYDSFPNLEFLNLRSNELQGNISDAIQNLRSISTLDLSYNNLVVGNLTSFRKLCNLKSLSLSYLRINQEASKFLENLLSECESNKLHLLSLKKTLLFGHLTDRISQFQTLTHLYLSNNLLSGPIPMSIENLKNLEILDISDNHLNGSLPECFGQFSMLKSLDISNNSLTGMVSEIHFANLTKLGQFDGCGNSISLKVSPFWVPPFQAYWLGLRSWNLGTRFPIWLRTQKFLGDLDMAYGEISDTIPDWFWSMTSQFYHLNISHNRIYGKLPNKFGLGQSFHEIDLSSNNLEGPLPPISSKVFLLDLSNNSLSDSVSNFLCNELNETKQMRSLNLKGNNLSGEMPDCWCAWKNLEFLDMSRNHFVGNIPISIGAMSYLSSLHFRHNNFSGELTLSLSSCTKMVTLDLSENELVGKIPSWIGEKLSNLVILNLRSNKFHGPIPNELCSLTDLHILDLAHNDLSGAIPKCISNLSSMARQNSTFRYELAYFYGGRFPESAILMNKGIWVSYSTNVKYIKVFDLSGNKLFSEMPHEVTSLRGLQSLNLSNNFLTGKIPRNIGEMGSLESLDLSFNHLNGDIPGSISVLTFLSDLNLSYNNLTGKIPMGTQIQSFDASSFIGNGLCGDPVSDNCSGNGEAPIIRIGSGKGKGIEVDWFYVTAVLGFMIGLCSSVSSLVFCKRWKFVFFHKVDRFWLSFMLFLDEYY